MSIHLNKTINRICLVLILAWYLVPIITSKLGTIVVVGLYLCWAAASNLVALKHAIKSMYHFFGWYGLMLLMLVFGLYDGVTPLYFFTMTLLFAMPALLFSYCEHIGSNKRYINFKHVIILCFLVGGLNTAYVLAAYPMAAKVLAMGDSVEALKARYESMGCGGYNYVYSFSILCMPVVLSIESETKKWKIITLISIGINLIVLFMSQYTIALMLTATSFLLYFITKLFSGSKTGFVVGTVLIIVLSIGLIYLPQLLILLSIVTRPLEGMSQRFSEMAAFMLTGETGYNLGGRLDRYAWSWNTFIKHPILGAQIFGGGEYGQHSSILDQLARFGIVGTVGYFMFIFKCYKTQIHNNRYRRIVLSSFLVFLIFSFVNPTIYIFQVGMILLFAVPIITKSMNPVVSSEQ